MSNGKRCYRGDHILWVVNNGDVFGLNLVLFRVPQLLYVVVALLKETIMGASHCWEPAKPHVTQGIIEWLSEVLSKVFCEPPYELKGDAIPYLKGIKAAAVTEGEARDVQLLIGAIERCGVIRVMARPKG